MSQKDDWWVADASKNGIKYLVRARKFSDKEVAPAGLTKLIVITYKYDSDVFGMPALRRSIEEMEQFEKLLIKGVEKNNVGLKTSSITGAGKKILEYYTKDSSSFMAALQKALSGHSKFPIEIEEFNDPDWSSIKKLNKVRLVKGSETGGTC